MLWVYVLTILLSLYPVLKFLITGAELPSLGTWSSNILRAGFTRWVCLLAIYYLIKLYNLPGISSCGSCCNWLRGTVIIVVGYTPIRCFWSMGRP